MTALRIRRAFCGALVIAAALAGVVCDDTATLGPPEPGEIRGSYIRFDGSPLAGAEVRIGEKRTVTAANGTFRFTGIDPPYDLALMGLFFEGVTRNDPVITDSNPNVGYAFELTLSVQVPVDSELQTLVFVTGLHPYAPWAYTDPQTGFTSLEVYRLPGNDSRHATLHALRRQDGVIVDLALRALVLDGQPHTVNLGPTDFAPAGSFDIAGSVQMPDLTQSYVIRMSMHKDGTSMMLEARNGLGSVNSFAFTAPGISGAVFDVDVQTVRQNYSGFSYGQLKPIPANPGPLEIQLYNPPALLNPPDEAVIVDSTAIFTWDAGEGPGIYEFVLTGAGGTRLYTHRTQLSTADTPALRELLRPGYAYFWSIRKRGAVSSVDDLLTAENRGELLESRTTVRKFYFR